MMGKKVFIIGMVLGILFLTGGASALAQRSSQTATGTIFDIYIDKNAPGTKLSGPLSVYYEFTGTCEGGGPKTDMFYTVRLAKGNSLYIFEGPPVEVCYFADGEQAEIIIDFIGREIVGFLYPGRPWKLKSINNFIDGDITYVNGSAVSTSFFADIEIAVQ